MLKNMRIGKRLITVFIIVVLISSAAGCIGVVLLDKIDTDYSAALTDYGFAQGDIGRLGIYFQEQRAKTLYILTVADDAKRNGYIKDLAEIDANIDDAMKAIKIGLASELGQKVYGELEASLIECTQQRDAVIKLNNTVKGEGILDLLTERCLESSTNVTDTINTMLNDKSRIGGELSADLTEQTKNFTLIMVAIILGAIIIALVMAIKVSNGISKPIGEVEAAAIEMAKGNYDVDVTFTSRDEIGALAGSMRDMISMTKAVIEDTARGLAEIGNGNFDIAPKVEYIGIYRGIFDAIVQIITSLSEAMWQINQSSDQVATGADQVAGGAQALSQGATEQASSIQELSATIAEISAQIKQNAQNAANAKSQAELAGNAVKESNKNMQEMVEAMNDISGKSAEISKIIKTIEDIAFQTNILALNAAVEAARAGEAGKGFAVVADEVRNLAGKSAEAAKNTTALIGETVQAVENGTRIADGTAKAMLGVIDGTRAATDLIVEIAEASSEQASAATQVTTGIEQISGVVQTNSATAEESAAASEELSGQAGILKQLIGRFKLRDVSGMGAPVGIPSSNTTPPPQKINLSGDVFGSDKY